MTDKTKKVTKVKVINLPTKTSGGRTANLIVEFDSGERVGLGIFEDEGTCVFIGRLKKFVFKLEQAAKEN